MFVYGPHGHYSDSESETDTDCDPEELLLRRREECERKARRGEMDPRLEFAFQLLMQGTGLPRNEVMDHVFEGDMLDDINEIFVPHMRTKLMWYYQDVEEFEVSPAADPNKPSTSRQIQPSTSRQALMQQIVPTYRKKLFLTDGWDCPLDGICIYIFRTNTTKQLPEEGFQKDLFYGMIDAQKIGLITTVERIIEHVFMEALAHPSQDTEDDTANCPVVKNQLLPSLRSFCSALKVCEEVCNEGNLFDDGTSSMTALSTEEVSEMSQHPEKVAVLEERVKYWSKRLTEVLKESEQIRRENDSSGPQDELEYWKKRGAQFSQITTQVNSNEVQMTILCLRLAHSKILKEWLETDKKITFCYNEAKDNAKFIQALEKNCHSLYLDDPVKMKDSILGLLQTVRLIHSISQFYNTSERTSALMVKITNQMIETCKDYITCRGQGTIWSQDRALVKDKLVHCIMLNKVYRKTYNLVKNQPFIEGTHSFHFSENYIFGKFDAFCRRLSRIISMFELIDDYTTLFQRRMEGLLLGEALEESIQNFNEIKSIVMNKNYDYLDQRNAEFNADFKSFLAHTDELKENIGNIIEANFDSVWETPQGIRFLTRFEKVSEKIPLTRMDDKYERILKYCEKEVDRIIKMYKKQKDDPPVPIMFPPIAGRIKWARSLSCHLEEILSSVTTHHILKNLPATAELSRRHKAAEATLKSYETDMVAIWMNQHICDVDMCLKRHLLAVCPEQQKIKVNLHNSIPLLIRETDLMLKMDLPVPMVALTLYCKQEHFHLVKDHLKFLIEDLLTVVKSVKLEVRPLFLPHLVKLTDIVADGLHKLTWVSSDWKDFIDRSNDAIKRFKVLTERVHDVYTNRVLEVLTIMQTVQLHALPEIGEDPWTIDDFCDKMDEVCRSAATDLHRKSLMVEEAVEEILTLVRKARIDSPSQSEEDFFCDDDDQNDADSSSTQQQSDWSLVYECFEKPHILLSGGMSKAMEDMVKGAVNEMRRYYSRKVVDVLVRVTRQSLEALRKRFSVEYHAERTPVFVLNSVLMIPKVAVQPNLDEVQEVLNLAGKNVTSVSKGVGQWMRGKPQVNSSLTHFRELSAM